MVTLFRVALNHVLLTMLEFTILILYRVKFKVVTLTKVTFMNEEFVMKFRFGWVLLNGFEMLPKVTLTKVTFSQMLFKMVVFSRVVLLITLSTMDTLPNVTLLKVTLLIVKLTNMT